MSTASRLQRLEGMLAPVSNRPPFIDANLTEPQLRRLHELQRVAKPNDNQRAELQRLLPHQAGAGAVKVFVGIED